MTEEGAPPAHVDEEPQADPFAYRKDRPPLPPEMQHHSYPLAEKRGKYIGDS